MPSADKSRPTVSATAQLKQFIDKFEPKQRALIRGVRRMLRQRFPTATEMVYDNYNFFVIGYSPTQRPSDAIVSIAAAANGVAVCFIHGATLRDPTNLLTGSGNQTRFLRVPSVSVLRRSDVDALFKAAVANSRMKFASQGRGSLVIRSVSAKQRPRRKVARS
jgi:hypothetical protein